MLTIILVVHILVAIALIGLVLIQRGKGADIGAAFGSGASQTVFGSRGSASFLTRTTAVLATIFFVTSLSLAYLYAQKTERRSVTEVLETAAEPDGRPSVPQSTVPDMPPDLPPVPAEMLDEGDGMPTDVPVLPDHADTVEPSGKASGGDAPSP